MRKFFGILIGILVVLCLCGCINSNKEAVKEEKITLAGGTALVPIMEEAGKEFMKKHPNVKVVVSGGGSGFGIKQVGEGLVDIGMASRDVKPAEMEKYSDLKVYNIGLEDNSLSYLFENITHFVFEAQEDLIKLYDLRVLEKIPVKDIMTKDMIVINENDTISKLRQYIDKYRHMGYPVVDNIGKLVGIVTFNDLGKEGRYIRDIMTPKKDLILISLETSASESQSIMAKNDVGRLLVVDDDGNLVGLVSRGDIVKTYQVYSRKTSKIQRCARITNFYFYDVDKDAKLKKLTDDLILLMGGRDYHVSEKEDYIETLTKDWEPLAKIMKKDNKIDHISLTTKSVDVSGQKIVMEILATIEKYAFEEIVVTDHITLIDEKSSIQRVITDMTLFKESKKTFGTITIRSDF